MILKFHCLGLWVDFGIRSWLSMHLSFKQEVIQCSADNEATSHLSCCIIRKYYSINCNTLENYLNDAEYNLTQEVCGGQLQGCTCWRRANAICDICHVSLVKILLVCTEEYCRPPTHHWQAASGRKCVNRWRQTGLEVLFKDATFTVEQEAQASKIKRL